MTAVDNITLSVPHGEISSLLEPNGVGKRTLVKMLCALIFPNSGTVTAAGVDFRDERYIMRLKVLS